MNKPPPFQFTPAERSFLRGLPTGTQIHLYIGRGWIGEIDYQVTQHEDRAARLEAEINALQPDVERVNSNRSSSIHFTNPPVGHPDYTNTPALPSFTLELPSGRSTISVIPVGISYEAVGSWEPEKTDLHGFYDEIRASRDQLNTLCKLLQPLLPPRLFKLDQVFIKGAVPITALYQSKVDMDAVYLLDYPTGLHLGILQEKNCFRVIVSVLPTEVVIAEKARGCDFKGEVLL